MPRVVRYHPSFEIDVNSAREWYEERSRSRLVGNSFLDCVETAVEKLIADPELRSNVDFGIRYWPVEHFPYIVFYDLTDSSMIRILGVMHTSQDAHKWLKGRG